MILEEEEEEEEGLWAKVQDPFKCLPSFLSLNFYKFPSPKLYAYYLLDLGMYADLVPFVELCWSLSNSWFISNVLGSSGPIVVVKLELYLLINMHGVGYLFDPLEKLGFEIFIVYT